MDHPYEPSTENFELWSPMHGLKTWCSEPPQLVLTDEFIEMPWDCMHALYNHLIDNHYDEAVYDSLAAVRGDLDATLPGNVAKLDKEDFTIRISGAASFSTKSTESDVGGITAHDLRMMEAYIEQLDADMDAYDIVVGSHLDPSLALTSPSYHLNAVDVVIKHSYYAAVNACPSGPVRALPYSAVECGMPLDCLAAFEYYFTDLYFNERNYYAEVEIAVHQSGLDDLIKYQEFLSSRLSGKPDDEEQLDAQEFVAKLEVVDISAVPAEDLTCMYCWGKLGETDDDPIELKAGVIQADHVPIKMPCPHGHLIGKTCLTQLIDADIRQCPKCRVDIVALVG